MSLSSIDFFGLQVSIFSKEELIQSFEEAIKSKKSNIYYGYSLAALSYFKKYSNYYKTTSQFDVMVTDGRVFYLLVKFFGHKLKFDISIPQLTILAMEIANQNRYKVMIIGSTEEGYLEAKNRIQEKYKNIIMCKGRNGYFDEQDKKEIFQKIIAEKPNILLLGFPTPKKQNFALEIRSRLESCITIPCGGMIDVFAGKEKLSPRWIKKIGLASIYRHIQHPKRLPELFHIYWLTVKVFVVCFLKKYVFKKKSINITNIV